MKKSRFRSKVSKASKDFFDNFGGLILEIWELKAWFSEKEFKGFVRIILFNEINCWSCLINFMELGDSWMTIKDFHHWNLVHENCLKGKGINFWKVEIFYFEIWIMCEIFLETLQGKELEGRLMSSNVCLWGLWEECITIFIRKKRSNYLRNNGWGYNTFQVWWKRRYVSTNRASIQ